MNKQIKNALDTDPALLQRMAALIDREQPEIERLMRLAVHGGSEITELAGVISDGQGVMPRQTVVVPIRILQPVVAQLRDSWPELAEQFHHPRPDALPLLVFSENRPGCAQIGVIAVRDVGAKA